MIATKLKLTSIFHSSLLLFLMVVMAVNSPVLLSSSLTSHPSCRLLSSPLSLRRADNGRRVSFRLQKRPSVLFFCAPFNTNLRPLFQQCKLRRIVCEAQGSSVDFATISTTSVTESTWKTVVLESDSPVLVAFWAPWCGPCRTIEPILDELAKQYSGRVKCFRINADENLQVVTDYGIRSIPTVILFRDGEKKESVIGAVRKSVMVKILGKYLSS